MNQRTIKTLMELATDRFLVGNYAVFTLTKSTLVAKQVGGDKLEWVEIPEVIQNSADAESTINEWLNIMERHNESKKSGEGEETDDAQGKSGGSDAPPKEGG